MPVRGKTFDGNACGAVRAGFIAYARPRASGSCMSQKCERSMHAPVLCQLLPNAAELVDHAYALPVQMAGGSALLHHVQDNLDQPFRRPAESDWICWQRSVGTRRKIAVDVD